MAKYNIWSNKEDWDKLYNEARELGASEEQVKDFKKSQSFDSCSTYISLLKRKRQNA